MKPFLAVFGLALALRLALFGGILGRRGPEGFFQPDSLGYWTLGANLAAGHGFSQSPAQPYTPDAFRTPAYPFMVAALIRLGAGPAAVILVQILLSALACPIVAAATERLAGDRRAGLLAGALLALDIPSVLAANLVMTEALCALLLALGILAAARSWALVAGAAVGLAVLCRPAAVLLPLAWLPLFRGRRVAACLLACLAVVSPWLLRNARTFGSPFLSTVPGVNLLRYRAAEVLARAEGIPLGEAADRLEARLPPGLDPLSEARTREAEAWAVFQAHPWEMIGVHVRALDNLLVNPERRGLDLALGLGGPGETSRLAAGLCVVQVALLVPAWAMFGWGAWSAWRSGNRAGAWLAVSGVVCLTLATAGPEAYARFRVPIMPFLAAGAGMGAAAWLRASRRTSAR